MGARAEVLDAAKEHDADIIGLSGLITPSLDEMVNFASEMERQGFDIPLLIVGPRPRARTRSVKVDKKYHGPVVWVKDASRVVPVVAALLSDDQRPALLTELEAEYDSLRERHAARSEAKDAAADRRGPGRPHPDRTGRPNRPPRPHLLAQQAPDVHHDSERAEVLAKQFVKTFHDYPIAELRDYIDWQPFFNAWEMKGKYPDILNNPASGETARKLWTTPSGCSTRSSPVLTRRCRALIPQRRRRRRSSRASAGRRPTACARSLGRTPGC